MMALTVVSGAGVMKAQAQQIPTFSDGVFSGTVQSQQQQSGVVPTPVTVHPEVNYTDKYHYGPILIDSISVTVQDPNGNVVPWGSYSVTYAHTPPFMVSSGDPVATADGGLVASTAGVYTVSLKILFTNPSSNQQYQDNIQVQQIFAGPPFGPISVSPNPAAINQKVAAKMYIFNNNSTALQLIWDWGDNQYSNAGAPPGFSQIDLQHQYAAAGNYTITCSIFDEYGNTLATQTAAVVVSQIPTQLSATATPTVVAINKPFTISGTLNTTDGTPIAGATIQLQKNVSGVWMNVAGKTNITTSNGSYAFNTSEGSAGAFDYRATYPGNDTYAGTNSSSVTATVNKVATQLSATANPTTVAINKPFTISGTLNTTDGTPIAGATIQLQKNVSGVWMNVAGKTNITTSNGAYRIGTSEPTAGTYQYRTTYAGNDTYVGTNSSSASVKVVSKASVLADINALTFTVLGTPSSAFAPGMKVTTLAVISATEVNVRVGSYAGATTELKSALLPRMDGCARTGKPDSDDWVRTCAAQGILYPQVQNLIQELQALQGS